MTQSAPSYQPYQQPPPVHQQVPPPRRAPGGLNGLLAAVAALVAAALAVGGLFGSLRTYRNVESFDGGTFVVNVVDGWWGTTDEGSTESFVDDTVLVGLGIVLAAVLLVAGAVFLFLARARGSSAPTAGRALTVAGAGVLTGVVLTELFDSLAELSQRNEEELSAGQTLEFSLGIGLFLPLGAVVVGIVAAVLAHLRQTPARPEPATPPMGFRQPYAPGPGYAQPHAPVAPDERPTTVDTPSGGQEADVTQQVTVHENPAPGGGHPQTGPAQPGPAHAGYAPAGQAQGVAQQSATPVGPAQQTPAQQTPAQQSPAQPGLAQQGVAQQAAAPQGFAQPGVAQPGPAQAGPAQQGAAPQGFAQPATPQHSTPPPGVALPGTTVGAAQPFATPPPMPEVTTPAQGAFAAPPQPVSPVEQALVAPATPPTQAETPTPPQAAPAPQEPAPTETPATPAAAEVSTEEPPTSATFSGLSDLPAAPPAPELSDEDAGKKDTDK